MIASHEQLGQPQVRTSEGGRANFPGNRRVILVTPEDEAGTKLVIVSRMRLLRVIHIPEKDVIRWDTEREYAFDRIAEPATALAKALILRVTR